MKKILLILISVLTTSVTAQHIVINEVYGAGGNAGAVYRNDYVELFNPGPISVALSGWTVQYASATGTGAWQATPLTGAIASGGYYLIQLGGGANGQLLPTADVVGTTAMAATAGKVALVSNATPLSGACPLSSFIIDKIGYGANANCFEGSGPTPAPSASMAVMRQGQGVDSDNNPTDFHLAPPEPRNSQRLQQTITFASQQDRVYGESVFELSATSTSGLLVSFQSSDENIASITNTLVTLKGAGQVTITAKQAGNGQFDPALDVARILTVNKALLTVTANDQTRLVGDANPPLTLSYSGFVPPDTEAMLDVLPVASTTADASSPPGTYTIQLTGGSDNGYTYALVSGHLFVNPAATQQPAYLKSPVTSGVDLSPRLTCSFVAGATTYTIEINTLPDFSGISMVQSGPRSQVFKNLSCLTTYYVRVKTDLVPSWGPVRSFTTGAPLEVSHVIQPSNNEKNVSWLPTIVVNEMGAGTYTLQLCTDWSFTSVIEFSGNTTSFQVTQALQYNTKYFARTRNNLTASMWGPTRSFTTGTPESYAFMKVPENNAVGVNYQLNVVSVPVPGASRYTASLSASPDFSEGEMQFSSPTRTIPVMLLPATAYYCRINTDLSEEWGEVRSFTTGDPASLAYVIRPLPGATNVSLRPYISSQSIAGAELYSIELNDRPDFTGASVTLSSKSRSIRFTLDPGKTYYTRVKTDLTPNAWGTIRSFSTVDALGAQMMAAVEAEESREDAIAQVNEEHTPIKSQLRMYPNPFTNTFTLLGASNEKRMLWIRVVDFSGKEVYAGALNSGGSHVLGADWAPGVYVVRVWNGEGMQFVRMVKR